MGKWEKGSLHGQERLPLWVPVQEPLQETSRGHMAAADVHADMREENSRHCETRSLPNNGVVTGPRHCIYPLNPMCEVRCDGDSTIFFYETCAAPASYFQIFPCFQILG